MRNIKNYVVAAFTLFLLDGCDFLDYDETSGKTKEEAYSYFNNMNSSVAYVYSFLPTDFGRVNDAMMESATDNAVYTWENNSIYYIAFFVELFVKFAILSLFSLVIPIEATIKDP